MQLLTKSSTKKLNFLLGVKYTATNLLLPEQNCDFEATISMQVTGVNSNGIGGISLDEHRL